MPRRREPLILVDYFTLSQVLVRILMPPAPNYFQRTRLMCTVKKLLFVPVGAYYHGQQSLLASEY